MKRILLVLALVLSILTISPAISQTNPQQKTWEYKFDDKCSEKRSNDLATQGWELASMSMGTWGTISTPTCVFKRAK